MLTELLSFNFILKTKQNKPGDAEALTEEVFLSSVEELWGEYIDSYYGKAFARQVFAFLDVNSSGAVREDDFHALGSVDFGMVRGSCNRVAQYLEERFGAAHDVAFKKLHELCFAEAGQNEEKKLKVHWPAEQTKYVGREFLASLTKLLQSSNSPGCWVGFGPYRPDPASDTENEAASKKSKSVKSAGDELSVNLDEYKARGWLDLSPLKKGEVEFDAICHLGSLCPPAISSTEGEEEQAATTFELSGSYLKLRVSFAKALQPLAPRNVQDLPVNFLPPDPKIRAKPTSEEDFTKIIQQVLKDLASQHAMAGEPHSPEAFLEQLSKHDLVEKLRHQISLAVRHHVSSTWKTHSYSENDLCHPKRGMLACGGLCGDHRDFAYTDQYTEVLEKCYKVMNDVLESRRSKLDEGNFSQHIFYIFTVNLPNRNQLNNTDFRHFVLQTRPMEEPAASQEHVATNGRANGETPRFRM